MEIGFTAFLIAIIAQPAILTATIMIEGLSPLPWSIPNCLPQLFVKDGPYFMLSVKNRRWTVF